MVQVEHVRAYVVRFDSIYTEGPSILSGAVAALIFSFELGMYEFRVTPFGWGVTLVAHDPDVALTTLARLSQMAQGTGAANQAAEGGRTPLALVE